jgi:hypothetical protein
VSFITSGPGRRLESRPSLCFRIRKIQEASAARACIQQVCWRIGRGIGVVQVLYCFSVPGSLMLLERVKSNNCATYYFIMVTSHVNLCANRVREVE